MCSYTDQALQATTCTTVPYNNYLAIYCNICRHNLYCLNKICPYVKLNYIIYLTIAICNCYNYNIIHKFYIYVIHMQANMAKKPINKAAVAAVCPHLTAILQCWRPQSTWVMSHPVCFMYEDYHSHPWLILKCFSEIVSNFSILTKWQIN